MMMPAQLTDFTNATQSAAADTNVSIALTFSVVMCAYTEARWNDMIAAVASLKAQTVVPHEIILVIDHNAALYQRTLAHYAHESLSGDQIAVRVIENAEARGLSGARNTGLAAAQAEIIAFIDEDAAAASDWLAQLAANYADAKVMGVGGAIHPVWLGGRPKWFPEEFDWVVGCTYRGMPETRAAVRNMIGCNMSLRREICAVNGGFRSGIGRIGTLPVGCEETEYCIRALQRFPDQQFIFEPAARVYHNVPQTRGTWRYFRSRCYAEGISKALIGEFVGAKSSLSSEKTYVIKTLPRAFLRGIARTFVRFDLHGLAQSTAVVMGLGLTGVGYLKTRAQQMMYRRRNAALISSPGLRQEEREGV